MSTTASDPHVRRLARTSLLSLVGTGIGAVASLGLIIVVTNKVPASTAGSLFVATSLFIILMSIADLGVDLGVVRYVASAMAEPDFGRARAVVRAAIKPVIYASIGVSLIIAALAEPLAELTGDSLGTTAQGTEIIRLLALFLPVAVVGNTLIAATRGFRTMRPTAVLEQVRFIAQFVLTVIAAVGGAGAIGLTVAWLIPYLFSFVGGIFWYRIVAIRHSTWRAPMAPNLEKTVGHELWRYCAPRVPTRMSQAGLQRLDIILVGSIAGPTNAAIYTAATRFVVLAQQAMQAVQQSMQPVLSRVLALGDGDAAVRVFERATAWTMAITWPMLLAVAGAPVLYLTFFGSQYSTSSSAVWVVIIMALTLIYSMATGPVDVALLMSGRSVLSLINNVLTLVLNIALNLWLIPEFGIVGAAISWGVAILFRNTVPLVQVRLMMGLRHDLGDLAFIASSSAFIVGLPALATTLLDVPVIPSLIIIGLAVCAYGALMWRRRERLGIHMDQFRTQTPDGGAATA